MTGDRRRSLRHSVTKQIEFSYGHRLINYDGKCKYLHGHNGLLEVEIAADELDGRGMVLDFGDLKRLVEGWVNENLDHKLILCRDDPLVEALSALGQPIYLLDDNPTAENIARHIFLRTRRMGLHILEARLWETQTSFASYRDDG